jgi:hypothetical protein
MISLVPTKTYVAFLCLLVLSILIGCIPVQAQTNAGTETNEIVSATSSDATTTQAITAPPVRWFTSEMISGNDIAVGDFVVGPGRLEVTVRPGESVTKLMTVTNRISDDRDFELTVEDMSGSADGEQAVVLLGDVNGPYTLKNYISFPGKTLNLDLGERAQVPVTITMPPNAEPGGYYGAVLVSTVQAGGQINENTARSPIVARIGTLFFITVPGDVNVAGELKDLSTKNNQWWYQEGPVEFGVLFENTGSVHLNPYGEIKITNMFGEEVGFVELEPWFILPKALRLREVVWDRELLAGRYTATAQVNRGYDDMVDTQVTHFWVVPWKLIAIVFGTLFVVFFIIRLFLRTFEFKRKS